MFENVDTHMRTTEAYLSYLTTEPKGSGELKIDGRCVNSTSIKIKVFIYQECSNTKKLHTFAKESLRV